MKPILCDHSKWVKIDGHFTYDQAKTQCALKGLNMATILDLEEAQQAYKLCKTEDQPDNLGNCWIGYSRINASSEWIWESGSNSKYTRWGPNRTRTIEWNCGNLWPLNDGEWNSDAGNFRKPVLCDVRTYDELYVITDNPTTQPTSYPTADPTVDPTIDPSADPSNDPTEDPTKDPTNDPTENPSYDPTSDPTTDPVSDPTEYPTMEPTMIPSVSPTLAPSYCRSATFQISKQVTNVQQYDELKSITDIILYGGQSLISSNCIFMLGLEWCGNLRFVNMNTKETLWQTNAEIYNDYSLNGLNQENLRLFMSNDTLYLIEDKYPTSPHLKPYILWKERIGINRRRLFDFLNQDQQDWQIIVSDDGYVALYRNVNDKLILYHALPTINDVIMQQTTSAGSDNNDDDKTPASLDTESQDNLAGVAASNSDNESDSDDLIWLWVILVLLILFCIGYMLYHKYKKRKEMEGFIDQMPIAKRDLTQDYNNNNDEDDGSDIEDQKISNWIKTTMNENGETSKQEQRYDDNDDGTYTGDKVEINEIELQPTTIEMMHQSSNFPEFMTSLQDGRDGEIMSDDYFHQFNDD